MRHYLIPLFSIAFTSCISASPEPTKVAPVKRQTNQSSIQGASATTSTTSTPTTTSEPDEINEPVNVTLNGQIFPPSIQVEGLTTQSTDFTMNCLECSIIGDFSLSAGDNNFPFHPFKEPSDVEQRGNTSDFDFKDIWMAATVDYLNATFELSVNLTASNETNEIKIPLYSQTYSKRIGILTLTATISAELHGWINTTNDVNFTYGFNFGVPADSEILLDLTHPKNWTSLGFNETTLTPTALNSTRSDLDIDLEFGLRPSVAFTAEVDAVVASGSVALDVGLDIPKLDVAITQVHNVTSTCDPAPPSLSADKVYANLTLVSPSVGFDVFETLNGSATLVGVDIVDGSQGFEKGYTLKNLTTSCLFLDVTKKSLAPAPDVKPAQLTGAAVGRVAPFWTAIVAIVSVMSFVTLA